MKRIIFTWFTILSFVPSFAQIDIINETVIPCGIQPNLAALSPDGSILVVGGNSKKLRIYNTNSGEELSMVPVKDVFAIYDVKFAPDGESFAAAGDDYVVVFNSKTYEVKFEFKSNSGFYNSISYSPDSKKLAVAYHNSVRIWDLTTAESQLLTSGNNEITKIAWSPIISEIALVDHLNEVTFWDLNKGKRLITNKSQKDLINCASYSRDGDFLYTCSAAGYINIVDVLSGENIKQLTIKGHHPWFVIPAFLFKSIISGGEDGRLICWGTTNYEHNTLKETPNYRLLSCSVNDGNNKIAVGLTDKSVHILTIRKNDLTIIKEVVSKKTKSWQQQSKFEKSVDYFKRVSDSTRIRQIDFFTQLVIDSLGQEGKSWALKKTEYDADNEIFKLLFYDYPPVLIHVPIGEAENFDKSIKSLLFKNPKFTLGEDRYVLMHLDITNQVNNKTYSYDKKEVTAFNPDKLELEFDPINIAFPKPDVKTSESEQLSGSIGRTNISDIDQTLPQTTNKYPEAYALIIGNEDYTKYNPNLSPESNVPFARNDAKSFYNYALNVLGIPSDNIFFFTDAIGSVMKREIERLCKMANYKDGKADLFFYYAGHGFPDEESKKAYILPVDISSDNLQDGIKLTDLYRAFSTSKAHRTFVILDACFSGQGRDQSLLTARAVKIKPQEDILEGNIVVISAVKSDQRSLPYNQQKHGIFTYYLLKYFKETNGNVKLSDLEQYLDNEVPMTSLKLFGIEQTPQIYSGYGIDPKWKEWTLKEGK
jgi:WD40 repeat protein